MGQRGRFGTNRNVEQLPGGSLENQEPRALWFRVSAIYSLGVPT